MNWIDIVSKLSERNDETVQMASFANIAGADIKFDKGYGTIKINVPADVANDLTNGSHKYMGGLLLIDRQAYEQMKCDVERALAEKENKDA